MADEIQAVKISGPGGLSHGDIAKLNRNSAIPLDNADAETVYNTVGDIGDALGDVKLVGVVTGAGKVNANITNHAQRSRDRPRQTRRTNTWHVPVFRRQWQRRPWHDWRRACADRRRVVGIRTCGRCAFHAGADPSVLQRLLRCRRKNINPVVPYNANVKLGNVLITANTNYNGSGGTLYDITPQSAKMMRALFILVQSRGTDPATIIRLHQFDPLGAISPFYRDIPVPATVASNTVPGYSRRFYLRDVVLPAGHYVKGQTTVGLTAGIVVTIHCAEMET